MTRGPERMTRAQFLARQRSVVRGGSPEDLAGQMESFGFAPEREHRAWCAGLTTKTGRPRRWAFDLAYPSLKVACEVDGGLFVSGGHSRGRARMDDMEKDAEAMALGWRVLRVATDHVKDRTARRWLVRVLDAALASRGGEHERH